MLWDERDYQGMHRPGAVPHVPNLLNQNPLYTRMLEKSSVPIDLYHVERSMKLDMTSAGDIPRLPRPSADSQAVFTC